MTLFLFRVPVFLLWKKQFLNVDKCSFGESNSHEVKFLYFSGRKQPHNILLALKCFNIQGQDDKSDGNKYIERVRQET